MTAILRDAQEDMVQQGFNFEAAVPTEVLYADDTLLLHTSVRFLEAYMKTIEKHGRTYGLVLNFSKVEALPVRDDATICNSNGSPVATKQSLKYLGAALHKNGQVTGELKQKLKLARNDFKQLSKVWNHASVPVKTKHAVFQQCIVSKLLYGLESAWLLQRERKMLDSFYIRCLRQIYGIRHSMISRVSNEYPASARYNSTF